MANVEPRVPDTRALDVLREAEPRLAPALGELAVAAGLLTTALADGGTMFLAGNGGSMADALHIAGELKKSFERPRPLPPELADALRRTAGDDVLAGHLQAGLRVLVLGADPVLASAVDNDLAPRGLQFAQELVALARPGDALVLLSTSGRSANVLHAATLARALDLTVVAVTGRSPGERLEELADVVVHAPSTSTAEVQTEHSRLYHGLCRVLEDTFFPAGDRDDQPLAISDGARGGASRSPDPP